MITHCALFQAECSKHMTLRTYCPRRDFSVPRQWMSMTHLKQDVVSLVARYSQAADTIRSHIYIIGCIKKHTTMPPLLVSSDMKICRGQNKAGSLGGISNRSVRGKMNGRLCFVFGLDFTNRAANKVSSLSHFLPF